MPGGEVQFTADVIGTTQAGVNWSASAGSIATDGLYTAPSAEGTYTVTVRLAAFPTKYSEATVNVQNPGALAVNVVGTIGIVNDPGFFDFWTSASSTIESGFDCAADDTIRSECSIVPSFSRTSIPYALSGCAFSASINRDSPSVIGVDISASFPADELGSCPDGSANYSLNSGGGAFVTLDIRATKSGYLTLQTDPQWVVGYFSNPVALYDVTLIYFFDPRIVSRFSGTSLLGFYGFPGLVKTTVPIAASSPVGLTIRTFANGGSTGVNLNAARVLTISFSESP